MTLAHNMNQQFFWQDEGQKAAAQRVIAELRAQAIFDSPIVTRLMPAAPFWPAEAYHQNYFVEHPEQSYCSAVIAPKVAKFCKQFYEWLKR